MNGIMKASWNAIAGASLVGGQAPQGGNRIEIVLSEQYRDYGGMKLDPIVVEKSWKSKSYNDGPFHKIPLKSQSLYSKN